MAFENLQPQKNIPEKPEKQEEREELLKKNEEKEKEALADLKDLGLRWEDLAGKKILDVGAGPAGIAEAARKRGIDVISLDRYPDEIWKDYGYELPEVPYVKADAMRLPFPDNTFDLIISRAAPPMISLEKRVAVAIIKEFERVLKDGGEARFGPGNINVFTSEELFTQEEEKLFTTEERIKRIGEKALEFLKRANPNITREPIKNGERNYPANTFYRFQKITDK